MRYSAFEKARVARAARMRGAGTCAESVSEKGSYLVPPQAGCVSRGKSVCRGVESDFSISLAPGARYEGRGERERERLFVDDVVEAAVRQAARAVCVPRQRVLRMISRKRESPRTKMRARGSPTRHETERAL